MHCNVFFSLPICVFDLKIFWVIKFYETNRKIINSVLQNYDLNYSSRFLSTFSLITLFSITDVL
jgi:hypothetical protein